jgi:hypothetical protein
MGVVEPTFDRRIEPIPVCIKARGPPRLALWRPRVGVMNVHTPGSRFLRNNGLLRHADTIVDAAAVFAQRGYHGASTQAIADVLGCWASARRASPPILHWRRR